MSGESTLSLPCAAPAKPPVTLGAQAQRTPQVSVLPYPAEPHEPEVVVYSPQLAENLRAVHPSLQQPTTAPTQRNHFSNYLKNLAESHPGTNHHFFKTLSTTKLTPTQICSLLKNYDAHAQALRRLLLLAATIMPEAAVGFVLENVRNEYGNGDPNQRHQLQLIDLAYRSGVSRLAFEKESVHPLIDKFIDQATQLYYPSDLHPKLRPAVAAGAIAATELLAIKEFQCLQQAFATLNLGHHIWFDHVTVEIEHSHESLDLSLFFILNQQGLPEVELGLHHMLNANILLYDALSDCLQ